jgi:hypothetical protein
MSASPEGRPRSAFAPIALVLGAVVTLLASVPLVLIIVLTARGRDVTPHAASRVPGAFPAALARELALPALAFLAGLAVMAAGWRALRRR